MSHFKPIPPGTQYGRLEVLQFIGCFRRDAYWQCQCTCGEVCIVRGTRLRDGSRQQCGLHRQRFSRAQRTTTVFPRRLALQKKMQHWTMPSLLLALGVDYPDLLRTGGQGYRDTHHKGGFWMRHEDHLIDIAWALKAAWRKRLLEYHPDRPGGSLEVTQHINMLYGKAKRLLERHGIECT